MHFIYMLKLSITHVLNITKYQPASGVDACAWVEQGWPLSGGRCCHVPRRALGLPFLTEPLPGSILAVFSIPEMHLERVSSCSTCKVLQKGKICTILFWERTEKRSVKTYFSWLRSFNNTWSIKKISKLRNAMYACLILSNCSLVKLKTSSHRW